MDAEDIAQLPELARVKIADMGSVDAWKTDFVDRLGKAAVANVNLVAQRSPWHFEIDQDNNLQGMDEDEVAKLCLGRYFDVVEKWDENDDAPREMEEENLKGVLREICRADMAEEFEALAESLGQDEDDLLDDLVDEEDLGYQALEIYEFHRSYTWHGKREAVAQVTEFALDPGVGGIADSDLFNGLRALRIPIDLYLKIAGAAVEGFTVDDTLSDDQVNMLGLDHVDLESEEGSSKSWAAHYEEHVADMAKVYTSRRGLRLDGYDAPPVADAEAVIRLALESDGKMELFLHTIVDGDTIQSMSKRASCHDLRSADQPPLHFEILQGYLSCDKEAADDLPYAIEIDAPMRVAADAFSITDAKYISRSGDVQLLSTEHETWTSLYQLLLIDRKGGLGRESVDPDRDAVQVKAARELLQEAPGWAAHEALRLVPLARHPAIASVISAAPTAADHIEAVRHLRGEIERLSKGDDAVLDQPELLQHIRDLLPWATQAAVCAADADHPATLFEKACEHILPLDLVDRIAEVSGVKIRADDEEDNALTRLVKRCQAIANIATSKRLNLGVDLSMRLIESGLSVPERHLKLTEDSVLVRSMTIDQPRLMVGLLDRVESIHGPAPHADCVQGLFIRALRDYRKGAVVALLDRGADADARAVHATMAELRNIAGFPTWNGDTRKERVEELDRVLRAHTARKTALEALYDLHLSP